MKQLKRTIVFKKEIQGKIQESREEMTGGDEIWGSRTKEYSKIFITQNQNYKKYVEGWTL